MSEDYVDQVFREVQRATTAGLDLDTTGRAKQAAVEAILKMAEALRDADYPPQKFAEISRALAHATKMVDELTRLEEFAKGLGITMIITGLMGMAFKSFIGIAL